MRISDWSSDVCSSDLYRTDPDRRCGHHRRRMGTDRGNPPHLRDRQDMGRAAAGRPRLEVSGEKLPELDPRDEPAAGQRPVVYRSDGRRRTFQGEARGSGEGQPALGRERKRVVVGQSGSVRVDLGGGRIYKKKKKTK